MLLPRRLTQAQTALGDLQERERAVTAREEAVASAQTALAVASSAIADRDAAVKEKEAASDGVRRRLRRVPRRSMTDWPPTGKHSHNRSSLG